MTAPDTITYNLVGGPLDGRTIYHKPIPKSDEPILHRLTTCLNGEDIDKTACGLYRIVKREQKEKLPKGAPPPPVEYVGLHHPSKQDEKWHVVEPPKVEEQPKEKAAEAKPEIIHLPDNHPLVRRLKPLAELLAQQKKEKADGKG